jgi:ATP-binding cassette subfamily C protein
MRRLSGDLQQGLRALKAFKAMGQQRKLLVTLSEATTAYAALQQMEVKSRKFMAASHDLILLFGILLGAYVGFYILGMGVEQVGFIAVILFQVHKNISDLIKKLQAIAGKQYIIKKVVNLAREIASHKEINEGCKIPDYPSALTLENVSFSHGNRLILDSINLVIPPTGMTLILGSSGAGKTTLLDIICGFYQPTSGRIIIGPDDLRTVDLQRWRELIGYVTQEPNLINESIATNVAALDEVMNPRRIEDALKQAGAWRYVSRLPEGLGTNVGETGGRVSGGERQRISIARALARKPKILILDEPTASVDRTTEAEFIAILRSLKREVAVLAISHQPAFAEVADTVYLLENARLSVVTQNNRDERATSDTRSYDHGPGIAK